MRAIDADALKNKVLEWMPSDSCGIEEKEFPFETDIVASLMMEIEEAPTIEPEPHWIPCSEQLPGENETVEENETVIACTKYGIYPEARYSKEYGWKWAYESGADYWVDLENVIAWMPLPELFKAER